MVPALEDELVALVHGLRHARQERAARRASRGQTPPPRRSSVSPPWCQQSLPSPQQAAASPSRPALADGAGCSAASPLSGTPWRRVDAAAAGADHEPTRTCAVSAAGLLLDDGAKSHLGPSASIVGALDARLADSCAGDAPPTGCAVACSLIEAATHAVATIAARHGCLGPPLACSVASSREDAAHRSTDPAAAMQTPSTALRSPAPWPEPVPRGARRRLAPSPSACPKGVSTSGSMLLQPAPAWGDVAASPHARGPRPGTGMAVVSPLAAASPVQLRPPELPPMHPQAPPLVALSSAHASPDRTPPPSRAVARTPGSGARLYSQLAAQLHTDSTDSKGLFGSREVGSGGSGAGLEAAGWGRRLQPDDPLAPPPRSGVRLSVSLSSWCAARARHPPGQLLRLAGELACRRAVRAWRAHLVTVRRTEAERLGEVCSWRVAALMGSRRREPVACGRASVVRWAQPLQLRAFRAWRSAARAAATATAAAADLVWRRASAIRACAALRAAVGRALFRDEAARLAAVRRGWLRWRERAQRAAAAVALAQRANTAAALATSRRRDATRHWRARTLPAAAARRAAAVAREREAGRAVVAWREGARRIGRVALTAASAHHARRLFQMASETTRRNLRRWAQVAAGRRAASTSGCSRWLRRRALLHLCGEAALRAAAAAAATAADNSRRAHAVSVWAVLGAQGAAMRVCASAARAAGARAAWQQWGDRAAVSAAAAAIGEAAAAAGRIHRSRLALRCWLGIALRGRERAAAEAAARAMALRAAAATAVAWWGRGAAAAARRRAGALLRQRRAVGWARWVSAAARCKVSLARRERASRSLRRAVLSQWSARVAARVVAAAAARRAEAHARSARRRRGAAALRSNASSRLARASAVRVVGGTGRARALGGALGGWAERGAVWAAEQQVAALHRRQRRMAVFKLWVAEYRTMLRLRGAIAARRVERVRASRIAALRAWAAWAGARAARAAARRAKAMRCAAGGAVYSLAPSGRGRLMGASWPHGGAVPGDGAVRRLPDCVQRWVAAAPRLGREHAARDRLASRLAARRLQALTGGWARLARASATAQQLRSAGRWLRARNLHVSLGRWAGHAAARREGWRQLGVACRLTERSRWQSLCRAMASAAARGRWARLLAARARAHSAAAAAAVARWAEARRRRSAWLRRRRAADATRTMRALRRLSCGAIVVARSQDDISTADAAWRRAAGVRCARRWRCAARERAQLNATLSRAWARLRRRSAFGQWQLWYWGRLCALAAAAHRVRTVGLRVLSAWAAVVREIVSRRVTAVAAADRRILHTCLQQWRAGVATAKSASAQALEAAEAERWRASLAGRSSHLAVPSSEPPLWTHRFLRGGPHPSPARPMPSSLWGADDAVYSALYGASPDRIATAGASTLSACVPREQLAPAGSTGWGLGGGTHRGAAVSSSDGNLRLGAIPLPAGTVGTARLVLGGPPLSALVDEYEIERAAQHAATVERARRESNRARLEMLRAQSLAEAALGVATPPLQPGLASQPSTPGWTSHRYAITANPSVSLAPPYALPYAQAPVPPPYAPSCAQPSVYTPQPLHLSSPAVGGAAERLEGLLREFRSISHGAGLPPAPPPPGSAPVTHPPPAAPSRPQTPAAARYAPAGIARAPTSSTESPARASPGPHTLRLAAAAAGNFAAAGALAAAPGPRRVVRRLACASSDVSESGESDGAPAETLSRPGRASPPKGRAAEYIDRVRRGAAARRAVTPG